MLALSLQRHVSLGKSKFQFLYLWNEENASTHLVTITVTEIIYVNILA